MTLSVIEKEVKKMRAMAQMLEEQSVKVEKFCSLLSTPTTKRRRKGGLSQNEELDLLASLSKKLPPLPQKKPPQRNAEDKTM